jgi:uncharacterized membrane protein YhaH (DUF805 family)
MDWRTLFLSPEGRIGPKDFWIGVLFLFVVWVLSHVLHVLAPLIWLLMIYPWVCVFAKRLHDAGRSGWLILAPVAVGVAALILAVMFGGVGVIGALGTMATFGASPASWAALFAGVGVMMMFLCVAGVAKLAFTLWVGLSAGDPGENRYGPPPVSLMTATPPPAPPPETAS